MNAIYPIADKNLEKVKTKMTKFNIEKTFASEIDKADNSIIVYGIIGAAILFMIIYVYVEKIKTPTAHTVAYMFKNYSCLALRPSVLDTAVMMHKK